MFFFFSTRYGTINDHAMKLGYCVYVLVYEIKFDEMLCNSTSKTGFMKNPRKIIDYKAHTQYFTRSVKVITCLENYTKANFYSLSYHFEISI